MPKLQDQALDRANDVKPYLERALKDEQVREDVKSAILTAREIYGQLMGGRNQITAAAARLRPTRTSRRASAMRSRTFAAPRTASRARPRTRPATRPCS